MHASVNTSNEHHLKTLAISTLRDYIKAYNIGVEDITVKDDIVSGILAARVSSPENVASTKPNEYPL